MEKTNNNIPTPEELKAYIDESIISVTGTYEQSASVLMVDDSVIGTLGNFSASIGKAKSKKTFNVSAITAAALIMVRCYITVPASRRTKERFSTLTRNRARTIAKKFWTES